MIVPILHDAAMARGIPSGGGCGSAKTLGTCSSGHNVIVENMLATVNERADLAPSNASGISCVQPVVLVHSITSFAHIC